VRSLSGELGPFGGIGQQVDDHIDPQLLRVRTLDAQMEAPALLPAVAVGARNLDAELNVFRQRARVAGDWNAAAGLRLSARDTITLGKFRRIGEDRGLAVELSYFGLRQVPQRLDSGVLNFAARLVHPLQLFRTVRIELFVNVPTIGPLQSSLGHAPFHLPE